MSTNPKDRRLPATLAGFRGFHTGSTVIVCGCGHSLNQLQHPERFLTIGVNDVGRLFDPTYLVVLNPRDQFRNGRFRYVEESRARALFTQLDLQLRHPHVVRFELGQRGGTNLSDDNTLPFTRNSPYVALCLAAFLGARRIGLIGVDFTDHHFFAQTGRHPLARNLRQIDDEYRRLAELFEKQGVEVFNLSQESRLTAFPRISLADFAADRSARESRRLRIVQVARTNCAGAIWRIHDVLNRYTDHECRTITANPVTNGRRFPQDILFRQREEVRKALKGADVVHFHNRIDMDDRLVTPYRRWLRDKTLVLQYHTEPELLAQAFPGKDVVHRSDLRTLVVAQKQARFFPHSQPVPNVLDIYDPRLRPSTTRVYSGGPLKLLYTPTDQRSYPDYSATCRGKGYRETLPILKKLEKEGLVELTVVTGGLPWEELMPIKREHDVYVDEVVTGGYHLSSLEALSQGLVTIAHLDRETRAAIRNVVGRGTELPWYDCTLESLEQNLRDLCAAPPERVTVLKKRGRAWMEACWDPARLAQILLRCYRCAEEMQGTEKSQPVENPLPTEEPQPTENPPTEKPSHLERRRAAERRQKGKPDSIDVCFRRRQLLPVYDREAAIHQDLLDLRGTWKGRQVVIWGNGPSAKDVSTVWEDTAAHIGVNAAWGNLRDEFDAYCIGDQRFVNSPEKQEIAERAPGVRVYLAHMRDVLPDDGKINFVRTLGSDGFCSDLSRGAFHGFSVIWVAIQLAVWCGGEDILLVGCEHTYVPGSLRCYVETKPTPVEMERTLPFILSNYHRLLPIFERHHIRLRTVGKSRLSEAGVPQVL